MFNNNISQLKCILIRFLYINLIVRNVLQKSQPNDFTLPGNHASGIFEISKTNDLWLRNMAYYSTMYPEINLSYSVYTLKYFIQHPGIKYFYFKFEQYIAVGLCYYCISVISKDLQQMPRMCNKALAKL